MASRSVLLVGSGLESVVGLLTSEEFDARTAPDSIAAGAAVEEMPAMVVVVHGADADTTLALLEAVVSEFRNRPIPTLVLLDEEGGIPFDEAFRRGASDCMCLENEAVLVVRLRVLCRLGELASTVITQRAMIERHVGHILEARQRIESMRAEMEALLEHGPMVMYSFEAPPALGAFRSAGEIQHAHPTYLDATISSLVGYSAGDLVGDAKAWNNLVPVADQMRLMERAEQLFTTGRCTSRHRVRHADGRMRWVSDESRLVRRADGEPVAVVGGLRDVTREVVADEAVRESDGILEQARRLQGAQRLAGTIAHDFNNMLAIVMCHAQFAARLLPNDHPAQQSLDPMLEAVVRAQAGTKLLIQLSQRRQTCKSRVNLNAVVRDSVKLIKPLMGESIRVRTKLHPNIPRVCIERLEFENALINLCVNARDAMPMGGSLLLRTGVERKDADRDAPSSVLIEVTDSGTGMAAHVAEQCFEPFFTTKGQGEGTGLGLFSVAQTVRQSGGSVSVDSEQGRGTTVRIVLPAEQRLAATAGAVVEPMPAARTQGRCVSGERPVQRVCSATTPSTPAVDG